MAAASCTVTSLTRETTPAAHQQIPTLVQLRYTTTPFTRVLHQLRYIADIKMVIEL